MGTYTLKHVNPAKQRMEGVGRQVRDGCGDGWGCAVSRPGERQVSCRYIGNKMCGVAWEGEEGLTAW